MKTSEPVPTTPATQFTTLASTGTGEPAGSWLGLRISPVKILALAGLLAFTALPAVYAQSGTWTNDASGNWDDPANWLDATVAEGTDAVADFSTLDITANRTVTLDGAHTVGALGFGDTSGADGWMVTSNANNFALTLAVSSGAPTITVNNNAATNRIVLSGGQGFVKLGGGSLTLNGPANNYSGLTVVSNGTLVLQKPANADAIPGDLSIYATVTQITDNQIANSATVTVNTGGTYNPRTETVATVVLNGGIINQSSTETIIATTVDARSGEILQNVGATGKLDANTLTKTTSGTVLLTTRGSSSVLGLNNTIVNAGTLILDYTQNSSKLADAGTLTVNGGILLITNGATETVGSFVLAGGVITNASTTGDLRVPSGGIFDVRSGEAHIVLAGGGGRSLVKSTPGTVILTATNAYSGGTTINGGILQIGNGGPSGLPGSTSASIINDGQLVFNRSSAGGLLSLSSVISGTGSLTKLGDSTVALTGANSYSGSTTISNGVINLSSTSTLGDGTGALNLAGGTLTTTASRNLNTAPIPNPINVTADSAITTSSAATAVDLNLTTSSVGGSAGTLSFRNDGADGAGDVFDVRFSGGSFTFGRPIIITNNGSFGSTRLSSFNIAGTTQTFNGAISGNGNFRRSASVAATGGVTIFNADNTYSGTTAVNDGTLLVNGSLGAGAVTVSGASGFTGILGGNGTINGPVTIQSGGTLSPGTSIGRLTISNSLTFLANSTNYVEVNKTAGTNDVVRGLTSVSYAGTLVVNNLSGTLAVNDSFPIFSATSSGGNFAIQGTPGAGLAWNFNPATGVLSVISTGTTTINPPIVTSGNLVVTGTGFPPNGTYSWLTSTNVAAPISAWTTNNTGTFDGSGMLSNATPINPAQPARFYMLKTP
jgi:autotransporter-associated beta strand protein